MKSIKIHGKDYVLVSERLRHFRTCGDYEGWAITTELISNEEGSCIILAKIRDVTDRVLATGYARERDGDSHINQTSYIENCETSAIGRALASLGMGIDTSIASAEEVTNALLNQRKEQNMYYDPKHAENRDERTTDYPAGDYLYFVKAAAERQSKSGNPMIHLTLVVSINGNRCQVFDNLVSTPQSTWAIRAFCNSIGLDFDSGELTPDICIRKQGMARFGKDSNGYLEVKEYLPPLGDTEPSAATASDDEIPF